MAKFSEFTFPSSDGIHQICASLWLPDAGEPKAVVQIVHGVAEYVDRYDALARFLTEHGYAVCGDDHLGHGRTAKADSRFGWFADHDGWTLIVADEHALRQRMGERFPNVPYFLLGHSMGSFMTRTFLCRYPGEVSGAVLSGTGQESALAVGAGKFLAGLIGTFKGSGYSSDFVNGLVLGAYNKQFAPNRTSADWISRDEGEVDKYIDDPLCQFVPTVGMYHDMFTGLQYISSQRALSQMDPDTPVYLYSGDRDPVGGSGAGVKKVWGYFKTHGTKDLTLKLYEGGRHEMHNELNREQVFADLLAWLDAHCPKEADHA